MIKIFTLYHFEPSYPLQNDLFAPFLTGTSSERFPNDAGASVPQINDSCELAYYHIWKNLNYFGLDDDNSHIGFQQYRRLFFFDVGSINREFNQIHQSFYTLDPEGFISYRSDLKNATPNELRTIRDMISIHDVVTIKPWPIDNVAKHFRSSHGDRATDKLREVMATRGINIDVAQSFHPCCLFIMRVGVFKEYMREWCQFIQEFGMPCPGQEGHTERIYGYALERFWSLWYQQHRASLTTAEIPFVYCHAKIRD